MTLKIRILCLFYFLNSNMFKDEGCFEIVWIFRFIYMFIWIWMTNTLISRFLKYEFTPFIYLFDSFIDSLIDSLID